MGRGERKEGGEMEVGRERRGNEGGRESGKGGACG